MKYSNKEERGKVKGKWRLIGENIGKRGKVQAKMRTCGVEWGH
jgi:hypothetical protein